MQNTLTECLTDEEEKMFQAITTGRFYSPVPEWLNASLHTARWNL